jgi:DNA methylase
MSILAMFPHTFVQNYFFALTHAGDVILDPFSGGGTTLLESLLLDRKALAVDINPVAACVTGAKAHVPTLPAIESRLDELERHCKETDWRTVDEERRALPSFFAHAFQYWTLRELLFIRRHLEWRRNAIDKFITALALGSLHGEMDKSRSYFSNQMPRTISTKPAYSIRYWREHGLRPKRRRVFEILRNRARFRLQNGWPSHRGIALQADVRETSRLLESWRGRVQAIITSPPYLNVTNFEEDQWLRLWFLGGPPRPTSGRISKDDRHSGAKGYWRFLSEAWQGVAGLLAKHGFIVCRVGGKGQNLDALAHGTVATVRSAFPSAELVFGPFASSPVQRQTDNFRPGTMGCSVEADFVFRT